MRVNATAKDKVIPKIKRAASKSGAEDVNSMLDFHVHSEPSVQFGLKMVRRTHITPTHIPQAARVEASMPTLYVVTVVELVFLV